jgi:hypothetical protein
MQSTTQSNENQTMSLMSKRVLAFFVFGGIGGVLGFLCLLIPLSIWAIQGDPTGSGSGYFIAFLIFFGPVGAAPGILISGLVALLIIDRPLKATTRSRSDYVRFLVAIIASALLGIGMTWLTAWLVGITLDKISIPPV